MCTKLFLSGMYDNILSKYLGNSIDLIHLYFIHPTFSMEIDRFDISAKRYEHRRIPEKNSQNDGGDDDFGSFIDIAASMKERPNCNGFTYTLRSFFYGSSNISSAQLCLFI